MFDRLGLGDHQAVVNKIVEKIIHNLKYWPENEFIVKDSIAVFNELAQGYSSAKLLLTLESVKNTLSNHTVDNFAFLSYPKNLKYRVQYYSALGRLIFLDGNEANYQQFIKPLVNVMDSLQNNVVPPNNIPVYKYYNIGCINRIIP